MPNPTMRDLILDKLHDLADDNPDFYDFTFEEIHNLDDADLLKLYTDSVLWVGDSY